MHPFSPPSPHAAPWSAVGPRSTTTAAAARAAIVKKRSNFGCSNAQSRTPPHVHNAGRLPVHLPGRRHPLRPPAGAHLPRPSLACRCCKRSPCWAWPPWRLMAEQRRRGSTARVLLKVIRPLWAADRTLHAFLAACAESTRGWLCAAHASECGEGLPSPRRLATGARFTPRCSRSPPVLSLRPSRRRLPAPWCPCPTP